MAVGVYCSEMARICFKSGHDSLNNTLRRLWRHIASAGPVPPVVTMTWQPPHQRVQSWWIQYVPAHQECIDNERPMGLNRFVQELENGRAAFISVFIGRCSIRSNENTDNRFLLRTE